MIKHSDDRRARRSRNMMKQGLLELMREKPFASITAREVTERMDLNRGTFYLHYPDTGTLLRSIEEDMLVDAQRMIDENLTTDGTPTTLQPLFRTVLNYIEANRDAFHTLLANDSSRFLDRMQELISRNGAAVVRSRFPDAKDDTLRYLLSFITYGLIGLIQEWFRSGVVTDRESLVKSADRMVSGASECLLC